MKLYRNNKNNLRGIIAITVCGILLAIIAIIIYLNFELLISLFNKSNSSSNTNDTESLDIPYINSADDQFDEVFYVKPDEISEMIHSADSFTREFRIISTSNNDKSVTRYTLTKSGDKYRVESDMGIITFIDGEMLIQNKIYSHKSNANVMDLYDEIGITHLEDLYFMIENYESKINLSANGKFLTIDIINQSDLLRITYVVALEFGVIISETHYYDGAEYLRITTDNVNIIIPEDLPDNFFSTAN